MSDTVTWQRGTTEYLYVTVTADVTLSAQPVAVSFDRANWLTAAWTGDAGTTRSARALIEPSDLPAASQASVYVKVTDFPEIPVLRAGILHLQ